MSEQTPHPLGEGAGSDDDLGRIVDLAEALTEHSDPAVADQVTELLDRIDAWHRDGLVRLVDLARQWRGEVFVAAVEADPVAGTLLAAYGLRSGDGEGDGGAGGTPGDARLLTDEPTTGVPVRIRGLDTR